MPKVVGIDLAGMEKNPTGLCALSFSEDAAIGKVAITQLVRNDQEILAFIDEEMPSIIAIDAPLSMPASGSMRQCDSALSEYGVISPLVGGMSHLTRRGIMLKKALSQRRAVIECNAKVAAKMLGYFSNDREAMQRSLLAMGIKGDLERRMLTPDEIEAVGAAVMAYLYLTGKSEMVGGDDGFVAVPKL